MVGAGGMETWARVRSSAYGLMCGSLLPFSRRRGRVQALQNSDKAGGCPPVEVTRFTLAFAAACRRSRRAAPPGLHGKRLCFRCIVATRRFPGRYASAAYTPVCGGTTDNMPRIRAGGFLECCDMLRAGLVALRRFGVSVWFAMLRFGVTRRTGSRWHGMTYRECAAMRRYASGRGARYGSLWFGSPGVGGCVASRHLPRWRGPGEWRAMAHLSRYVAPCRGPGDPSGVPLCSA